MLSRTRFFYLQLIFGMLFLPAAWAQQSIPDLAWFDRFARDKGPGRAEKSLAAADARLAKARAEGDKASEARTLIEKGLLQQTRVHDYGKAMDLFVYSLALEDSFQLHRERVFSYLAIAQVFEAVGDYNQSANALNEALQLNEALADNKPVLVRILNELGRVHAAAGQLEHALDNYENVLTYQNDIPDKAVEAEARFNIAHLYRLQGKNKEALESHKRALSLRRAVGDRQGEARSLNDIGELYHAMKNDARALANHMAALEIRQKLKDKRGIAESYNNIGVQYYEQKNYARAISNLLLALDAGREAQAQEMMRRSYEYLSPSYKALGEYQKALAYSELSAAMNEFIQNERNERQLLETQNRYEVEKKELQIGQLEADRRQREQELATQKKIQLFLMALVGLGVVVAALILYLYIDKRRSNRELKEANDKVQLQNLALQELNATKDKFFSIISHDLKGPLNSLTSFSGLLINHGDSLSKDEIKMLAQDLDKSLKNLFALLENLLEWSRSQTGNIDFGPEAFDLNALLAENVELLQAQARNKQVRLVHHGNGPLVVQAHRNSINTVVRNLVSNAIKFTPPEGVITVGMETRHGDVRVSVADTGVGMPPEVMQKLFRIDSKHSTRGTANEKGTGLGLILCKDFVEKNGGSIGVTSTVGKGSVFYFSLPQQPAQPLVS